MEYISREDAIYCLNKIPKAKDVIEWHDADEPPSDDRYILISFSNFSLPQVGRYEGTEDEGGNYYLGDEVEPVLMQHLYVNAWMELPRYKEGK